jgi:rubrerythrin
MADILNPFCHIPMNMTTRENAMEAFAGESQANRKYSAFAEKAVEEGYTSIARLFRAASEAEAIHAKKLLKVLGAIEPTAKNVAAAVSGETHEYTEMYPAFLQEAEAEKQSDAALAFTYAMKAEEVHARLYKDALAYLKTGKDLANKKIYLCPVCGNIVFSQPPEKCDICGVFGKVFREII